jgi:hypothetical protein
MSGRCASGSGEAQEVKRFFSYIVRSVAMVAAATGARSPMEALSRNDAAASAARAVRSIGGSLSRKAFAQPVDRCPPTD